MIEKSVATAGEQGVDQNNHSFVLVPGRGAYPAASWLRHALEKMRLLIWIENKRRWEAIMRSFPTNINGSIVYLDVASIDLGNRAAKLCAQSRDNRLVTLEVPAVFLPLPKNQRSGKLDATTWMVTSDPNAREVIVGSDAMGRKGSRGFLVGSTKERFEDAQYLAFVKIALAQLLFEAGYSGTVMLALGIGIRNDEIVVTRNGQQVPEDLLAVLKRIKEPFAVRQTLPSGETREIKVVVQKFWPAIQTMGAFLAYFFNLLCEPAQKEYTSLAALDWGTHDLGYAYAQYVDDKPLQVSGDPIARGMIRVAEAIRDELNREFPGMNCTATMSLQAIIDGYIHIGGTKVVLGAPIPYPNAENTDVQGSAMEAERERQRQENKKWAALNNAYEDSLELLLGDANSRMQERGQLLLNVGGTLKAPTVSEKLARRLTSLKQQGEYLLCPEEVTTVLNAIGLYVYVHWQMKMLYDRWQQFQVQSNNQWLPTQDGMQTAVE